MEFNLFWLFLLISAYATSQILVSFIRFQLRKLGRHSIRRITNVRRIEGVKVYSLFLTSTIRWSDRTVDRNATIEIQIYFEEVRETRMTIVGHCRETRLVFDFTQDMDALKNHFKVTPHVANKIESEINIIKKSI